MSAKLSPEAPTQARKTHYRLFIILTLTEKLLPQFLLIVPLTPFPLGNFQPWEWELDEDNYWKPCTGAGTALAVNGPFLSA